MLSKLRMDVANGLATYLIGILLPLSSVVASEGQSTLSAYHDSQPEYFHTARHIIVVDTRVNDYRMLLASAGLSEAHVEIINADQDPIDAIARVLAGKSVESLHIVSHGGPGQLILGSKKINTAYLAQREHEIKQWAANLNTNADILLYGCDLAQGDVGKQFIEQLASLTRADVAASNNKTGHASLNADWLLETTIGNVEAQVFAARSAQRAWHSTLAPADPLYTQASDATGLGTGFGVNDSATWIMRDEVTTNAVVDWKATITNITGGTTVEFAVSTVVPESTDDPRIVNESAGTTTVRWESFDTGTATPHSAQYCMNIADLDLDRTETVTVSKSDLFNYSVSSSTNVVANTTATDVIFSSTGNNCGEQCAVRLCFKETDAWFLTYSGSTRAGFSHDADADFPFTGSVTTNLGFTVTQSAGSTSVTEAGSTDSFDVVLDYQPSSDVVIDVVSADTGEATVSASSLTFTNANWDTVQTITVTGVDDDIDDGDQTTVVTLSINDALSEDSFDPLGDVDIDVTTTDDDTAGFIIVESGSTAVSETGTTDTFTVELNSEPTSNVVIDVSSGDLGEATVSPASLTFTPLNWDMTQTVTVTGVDDVTVDGSQNTTITLAVNDAGSDDVFDPLADQTVTAATADDDSAGFSVAESDALTIVSELATTDTFTVVLDKQPLTDVVIDVSSGDIGEATVNPGSLTFTNGNWNVAQTVTVTGVDDALIDGLQNTTITVSVNDAGSDDAFDPLADQTVTATTTDNESPGFTVVESDGATEVDESGTTDTFTVVLHAQPATDVVIDLSSADIAEATVAPSSLTFTNGNWNSAQTVTVTGANDFLIDGSQNTGITIAVNDASSDDNYDPLADQTVTATTTDNDSADFSIAESAGSTSVSESGTVDTFTVVLNARPVSDVVIDVSSADIGEATVSPASLTFTNANWNVAQTVNVTGVDDSIIDGPINTTLTIAIKDAGSDDDFDPLADKTVSAETTDNDAAGFSIAESGADTRVSESATTDTFTVVLDAQPDSNVVIDISSGDLGEATVSPASLTFTAANWSNPQTVTVTGVNDTIVDGTQVSVVTLAIDDAGSDNNFDPLADQTVNASNDDNEVADFAIAESGGSTAVVESGTTDTFTVVLTAQPISNVVFDISSGDIGEATVAPASLTFTNGNWNVAQTVTVTGVDDDLIDGARNTTITVAINDAGSDNFFDPLADKTVTAATADDDVAGFSVAESAGSTSVNESGTTDTFTVVLDAQPLSDVVVDISSADIAEATVSPASLTFTNANWDTAQTVTVTGVDDGLVDGTQNTDITLSINDAGSDDDFDSVSDQTVATDTVDDDTAGFTVLESGGSTSVNESGTTDTFTVVLDAQPVSDVVIDLSSADTGEATVTPAALTFTTANWNTLQTVTVTGVDDLIIDGTVNTNITVAINDAGSNDFFDPLPDQSVTVATADNDVPGFTFVESDGLTVVNESGTTDTFTVVLSAPPASDVVIDLSSGDIDEATVSPPSLTFTNSNWNVAQTITVTGADDALMDGSQNTLVTLAVNDASSDDLFDPLPDQTVTVTTTDDDTPGFTVVEIGGSTAVSETGTTDDFIVMLNSQPATNVVFDISSGDPGEATVSPASLTFTNGNWSTPQTVTVSGVDDAMADGPQNTTLTISVNDASSDDGYDPLPDQTVTVTTADDDVAGFTITETGPNTTVDELGTTDTFTVVLDAQPASDVVIDIVSADMGEATVSSAALTFTSANWNLPQTITVSGVNDSIIDGDQMTNLTLSIDDAGSDDSFDPLADQIVIVTTIDNGSAGFTIAESGGSTLVNESGTTDSFTVVLDIAPSSDVVIDVSSADTGEVTVSASALTFTTANWNVAQTVTVTGVDDAQIDGNQNTQITLAINDAGSNDLYDPVADQFVTVITIDDDVILDDDNDGIPNIIEGAVDTDLDGINDNLDLDSDNDGIPDALEETAIPALSNADDDGDLIDNVIDIDLTTGGADLNFNGIDDRYEPIDTDSDGTPNHLDLDSDNDGLPDGLEADNVPVLTQNDADSDGIDDALDINITNGTDNNGNGADDSLEPRDAENDGRSDYLDVDSDNDGILDSAEADVTGGDADGDGIDDRFDVDQTGGVDADGDGVDDAGATDTDSDARPDYRELDSDNDGVPDVIEAALLDSNLDGFVDDATTTASPPHSDADGVADYRDVDSDNDGTFDIVGAGHTAYDLNSDGRIDPGFFIDPDFDGAPNVIDLAPAIFGLDGDGDGDGLDNSQDLDDDNDGIPDSIESPNNIDIDSDSDGLVDRLDKDSDNDGLPDSIEAFDPIELDSDWDGVIDNMADADSNGLADVVSTGAQVEDRDGDGVPDYLDLDSDNDGLSDLFELTLTNLASFDGNDDGRLDNTFDADVDGLADIIDPTTASGTALTLLDTDGDGIPNFRDIDSDNDGYTDGDENGDYNQNGQLDFLEDGGGITTSISGGGGSIGLYCCYLLLLLCRYRRKLK